MLGPLLAHLAVARIGPGRPRTWSDALLGDKAYSSRGIRAILRTRGVRAVMADTPETVARSSFQRSEHLEATIHHVHHTPGDLMPSGPACRATQRHTTHAGPPEKAFGRCTGPATPTSMQDRAIEYLSAHSSGSPNNVQTHCKLRPVRKSPRRSVSKDAPLTPMARRT